MSEHKHEWQIALNEVYCACQQTMTFEDAERRINEYETLEAEIEVLRKWIEKLENRVDDLAMKVMTAQSLMTEKQLYEYDELVRQRRQESIADLAPAKNAALGGQESE